MTEQPLPNKLNRRRFVARTAMAMGALAVGGCGDGSTGDGRTNATTASTAPTHAPEATSEKSTDVPAVTRQWGDLSGRFVYNGHAPERAKLTVNKDLSQYGTFDIRDESLMVGENGGVGNVYIYVRCRSVPICPELERTVAPRVTLDNLHWIFIPHCMTIWYPRQEFYIVNSDPVAQNVAFTPLGDLPANIVLPVGADATYRFHRKQNIPVLIHCNYHPWESAYILPREHPYVAVSALDGRFTIPKLPVGELEFQVWHERCGYLNTPTWPKGRFSINIKPGSNDLGTIELAPALLVKQ